MNYSSNQTSSLVNIFAGGSIVTLVIGIIMFLIHLVFTIFIMRMAKEKGYNGIIYAILAFIVPELTFVILYSKDDNYGGGY